ncbi:MinD-like ATPase involved in chromosome partitioning or flagellar assembly [Nocardioides zeae]|uniref:MinD-like ATPase involved in chromosome partitioning or flagellar assembly n=2 Tax=Nocardioides zeae TaxID=1457234 RepID=A0AAJ1X292_9ACTN|nr:hypothetical protein [Nocardioides zeae]MDQ1104304.1 MinD-like ATPase involved in chromosome partitioning or flagellar assembly [Nocardioides zeae]MDR6176005.1 MinD-like ATPase involved in chromosome partitioning or flagellar assembly [Nocardioides zeae]MDR6211698.1 MinD-like ATPase involved in chromosome partitioning or flagellar assembly [Nocardioides zeae]
MNVPPDHPGVGPLPDSTSERLYTTDELDAYAAQQDERRAAAAPGWLGDDDTRVVPPVPAVPPAATPAPAAGRRRADVPLPAQPAAYGALPPRPAAAAPAVHPAGAPVGPGVPAEQSVPRFMTATDFLDRRVGEEPFGPATWGWRGALNRWSGGALKTSMGRAEHEHELQRRAVQRDLDGPRTVVFLNPKGGAAKTTGVLMAGYTFGTVRGGGVVAWDNNETRGTLGIRGVRGEHRNTTRELLEDLEKFNDVYQSRIGDLGAFVRSQGDAHFDVLASDERPDVSGTIRADDFRSVHALLQRFYRLVIVDTGNNLRAENWLAAAHAADLLVVTSTVREDTGYSGLWMLDALADAGYADLQRRTVTVLSDPSPKVDEQLASDLVGVYEQRTRAVYRVPYDPVLVSGSVVPYARLSTATQRAWLRACAGMAEAL